MYDLLAPVSISILHSVCPNLPFVYPCPEIGNFPLLLSHILMSHQSYLNMLYLSQYFHQTLLPVIFLLGHHHISRYVSFILSSSNIVFGISSSSAFTLLYNLLCFLSSNGLIVKHGLIFAEELIYVILSLNIDQLIICSVLAPSLSLLFKIAIR